MKQANSIFSPETGEIKSWEELPYTPQPVTGNIFSFDYKVAECTRCHRILGINLLRKWRGRRYCFLCYYYGVYWEERDKAENARDRDEKARERAAKKAFRVKHIQQNPDFSLRELARRLNISHEAVRYWRKKIELKDNFHRLQCPR